MTTDGLIRSLLAIAVILGLPGQALGQDPVTPDPCPNVRISNDVTLAELVDDCSGSNPAARKGGEQAAEAKEKLALQPGGAATSPTFADRVSESLTNFLPLFSGVIDGVTTGDEGKSLVVRFNLPGRLLPFLETGLSVILREPELAGDVTSEATDGETQEALKQTLGDLDDPTYQLSLGVVRGPGGEGSRTWMVGRNPELYQRIYTRLAQDEIDSQAVRKETPITDELVAALGAREDFRAAQDLTVREILELLPGRTIADIPMLLAEQKSVIDHLALLSTRLAGRFQALNKLVERQPQAVLTASWRKPEKLIGPEELSLGLVLEASQGPNLNMAYSTLKASGTSLTAAVDATADRTSDETWTFSFRGSWTEKRADGFQQEIPDSDSVLDIQRDKSETIQISFAGSRTITSHPVRIEGKDFFPKLLLSLERLDVDDPSQNNRTIARLTYDVPVAKGVNLPLSVVWANHGEFLPETDEQLSAHVGFSYSLAGLGSK